MRTIAPKYIDDSTKKFCKSIKYDSTPIYVAVTPQKDSIIHDCVYNVENHVKIHGGEVIMGWAIWLVPKFLLEAEFHVIYKNKDNELIDLTPQEKGIDKVLFLPDYSIIYNGCQIKSKLKNISKTKMCDSYIKNFDEMFDILNRGDRKYCHGEISLSIEEANYYQNLALENKYILELFYSKLTLKPNEPCICGNNLKYVDCCKRNS